MGGTLEVAKGPILACLEGIQGWRQTHLLLTDVLPSRRIGEAIDHVSVRPLRIVALVVGRIWALVLVTPVAIGAPIPMQVPVQKWHRLHMEELVLDSPTNNIGITDSDSTCIR